MLTTPHTLFNLLIGTAMALIAGALWGGVFVIPLLLPEYPAAMLSVGRYLAFGLIAVALAALDWTALTRLKRSDWQQALQLSAVGNLLYYLCLSAAIQRAGGALPTLLIGTLPVVIALCARWSSPEKERQRLEWTQPLPSLLPSLLLMATGLALVNHHEMAQLGQGSAGTGDKLRYAQGALLAIGAVACWTWYPLRNARWLRENSQCSGRTWATAQGLVTLPLALLGGAMFWIWNAASSAAFDFPLGPAPLRFVGLMLAAGLLASWLGTLCWNEASQRLPTHLVGQLIVFETLAALIYVLLLRGQAPSVNILLGMALLIAGVLWALRSASSKPNQPLAQ